MSSPILPAEGLPDLPSSTPAVDIPAADAGALPSGRDDRPGELRDHAGTPTLQATLGGPPSELLEEIVAVDELWEQLRESGYALRFFASARDGRPRIELHDHDGEIVSVLTAAQAVQIAAASPTE